MKKIIIIGSRGHAKSVIDACEAQGEYFILGLVDDFREEENAHEGGHMILGKTKDIERLNKKNTCSWFIAIGDNFQRKRIYNELAHLKLEYANIIHPFSAIAYGADMGTGIVVMAGAIINRGCRVGSQTIINTKASLDHDCTLGEYSSLAPGVSTGGYVNIGGLTAIGLGASIKNKINIGNNNVIGCGALVLKDIPDNTVSFGFPCKYIKERVGGEKYL